VSLNWFLRSTSARGLEAVVVGSVDVGSVDVEKEDDDGRIEGVE
jgi:hypothetical protein